MKQNKIKQTPPRQWTYPTRIPLPLVPRSTLRLQQGGSEGRRRAGPSWKGHRAVRDAAAAAVWRLTTCHLGIKETHTTAPPSPGHGPTGTRAAEEKPAARFWTPLRERALALIV